MASPHASSFICLPFSDDKETKKAYEIYYYVCLGSASVGAFGAVVFLCQLMCGEVKKTVTKSQKNILVNLAISDFLADLGKIFFVRWFFVCMCVVLSTCSFFFVNCEQ